MKPSRIQAVDHIDLEAPFGLDDELRWFYGEVAGLEEVPAGPHRRGHLRFRSGRLELRVRFVENPRIDPLAIRLTLTVSSLHEAAEQLAGRLVPFERVSGFSFTDRRLRTTDPAGHGLMLKREWPLATL